MPSTRGSIDIDYGVCALYMTYPWGISLCSLAALDLSVGVVVLSVEFPLRSALFIAT